jgi:hypothetical protein
MNAFNRAFIAVMALVWVAALGAAIWLIWDQARVAEISSSSVNLNFDIIANTQAERILATIIAGAAMLPALILLAFEMKPSRRRDMVAPTVSERDVRKMQSHERELERDLAEERARNDNQRIRDADAKPVRSSSGSRRWHLFPRH